MKTILILGSIFGIVNSLILVIYSLVSKKGNKISNILFSFFVLMLIFQLAISFAPTFSEDLIGIAWIGWLFGYVLISPIFYLFNQYVYYNQTTFKLSNLVNLLPAIVFIGVWFAIDGLRTDYKLWNIFHRLLALHNILFLSGTIFFVNNKKYENKKVLRQLNIFSSFLCAIWLTSLLHEISGLYYLTGTLLYSLLIYITVRIVINKGFIIDTCVIKYQKTGLKEIEKVQISKQLEDLISKDKIYRDNTLSIGKVAKRINTSTHFLSQVINEHYHYSFFELISNNRINEAKKLLKEEGDLKISDIAYEIGYNSLSAFNTAFKKQTGCTPTQYRNDS